MSTEAIHSSSLQTQAGRGVGASGRTWHWGASRGLAPLMEGLQAHIWLFQHWLVAKRREGEVLVGSH